MTMVTELLSAGAVLHRYQNGNYTVTLYEDGTKVREFPDDRAPAPEYPESIDVKI